MSGIVGMNQYQQRFIEARNAKEIRAYRFAELIKTKTLRQIGAEENPPISFERVRQILATIGKKSIRHQKTIQLCPECGLVNIYKSERHQQCVYSYTLRMRINQAVLNDVKCSYCNKLIIDSSHETKSGLHSRAKTYSHWFCDNYCKGKWMAAVIGNGKFNLKVPCLNCNDLFKFKHVSTAVGVSLFCSLECNLKYRSGKYNSEYRYAELEHAKRIVYTYLTQKVMTLEESNVKFGLKEYGLRKLDKYKKQLVDMKFGRSN